MSLSQETLQKVIQTEFGSTLGREVDATADFFDEGGDSLAVETVLTKLSEVVGLDLPGWILLDHPTALGLSEAIYEMVRN